MAVKWTTSTTRLYWGLWEQLLQVEGHRGDGFNNIPVCAAVGRLGPVCVDTVYGNVNELKDVHPVAQGHLDDGVQRDLDVGELVEGALGEVGHDATDDGLVGDDQKVLRFVHLGKDFRETSGKKKNKFKTFETERSLVNLDNEMK